MKKALIIENDSTIKDCWHVTNFLKTWDGDKIIFTRFRSREKDEVIEAIRMCSDIVTQTALVSGSQVQFENMLTIMSKFKEPKTIHMALLGGSLFDYMDNYCSDEDLTSIRHHKIYEMTFDGEQLIDFTERINAHLLKLDEDKKYKGTAGQRLTGRQVLILACNATGGAFKSLKVGETVPEVDMSERDPNPKRGVWVLGDGEPVKLVNDCGLREYRIVSKMDAQQKIEEIFKTIAGDITKYSDMFIAGMESVISDEEYDSMQKANYLCEQLAIPKRYNRSIISDILSN